jgi:hypothetical protein
VSRYLTKKWAHVLALDSAAELIRAHLGIGDALPQSAYVPVEWPFGSREYTLIADDQERIAVALARRAGAPRRRRMPTHDRQQRPHRRCRRRHCRQRQ